MIVLIVLIDLNNTESMTRAMVGTARATCPATVFDGWTSHHGPPAIQGAEDGAAATPPLLRLVRAASARKPRCIVIACFDDTALDAARAIASCPVNGIGQAAYHLAALAGGGRFSVVTTLEVSVPILEDNVRACGLGTHLARVRASGVPVLDLETDSETATARGAVAVRDAARLDRVRTVVLGCGGMVDIERHFGQDSDLRLIDGVRAAAHVAAAF